MSAHIERFLRRVLLKRQCLEKKHALHLFVLNGKLNRPVYIRNKIVTFLAPLQNDAQKKTCKRWHYNLNIQGTVVSVTPIITPSNIINISIQQILRI